MQCDRPHGISTKSSDGNDASLPGEQSWEQLSELQRRGTARGARGGDFDLTLRSIDQRKRTITLLVRHVPPPHPQIHLPAAWMRTPVSNTPNNWVEVGKNRDGKYTASVGKETFDDVIITSLTNGRILSATMDNPVEVLQRQCSNAALTVCGKPVRYQIRRQIEIKAQTP
jgi:hypothetical protein